MSHHASRSSGHVSAETSHMTSTTTRGKKFKADSDKRAKEKEHEKDNRPRVLDPDNKAIDRTPLPLVKPKEQKQEVGGGVVRKAMAVGADRRVSSQAGGEGGSVSARSQSEGERSISQMEGSTSSDHYSTSTPEEESQTFLGFDDSSESHSTVERSTASNFDRRKSGISSDGTSIMTDATGAKSQAKQTTTAKAEPAAPEPLKEVKPKEWTKEERYAWMQQDVTVSLSETPTMILFSRQDEVVSRENAPESEAVRKKNERYENFQVARRGGESGGKYGERGMTTLNNPHFSVACDVHLPPTRPAGNIQVTTWKLYDEMLALNEEEEQDEGVGGAAKEAENEAGMASGDNEDTTQTEEDVNVDQGGPETGGSVKRTSAWLQSPSLLETLLVVERAVVMNNFEELQLAYRGITMDKLTDHVPPSVKPTTMPTQQRTRRGDNYLREEADKEQKDSAEEAVAAEREAQNKSKMRILWRFGNETTKNKNTSCMSWNRKNPDILAAGYGEYGIPGADSSTQVYSGIVCCWNMKNPVAPERTIHIESDAGVSAMHFSALHPSLLAVGNTDGTLALYDVRKHGNSPALKTTVSTGQHTGTIWELRWVEKGKDRGESLVSISADGHVMEWSIKKGLERTADLMKLKRTPNRNNDGGTVYGGKTNVAREALLSRQSGGMCFDIHPKESITYIVGTEDGTLHKCSKSQNENYLLDYRPHEEPVYRLRWSRFCPDYFITCSADWTSRLYHADKPEPLMKFYSVGQDAIHDVCWSHTNSTVFGTATAQGNVSVWDLADPLHPKSHLDLQGRCLNCILFAEQESPLLTVGDSSGDVTVVKLTGTEFERDGMTDREQEERFEEAVKKMTS